MIDPAPPSSMNEQLVLELYTIEDRYYGLRDFTIAGPDRWDCASHRE